MTGKLFNAVVALVLTALSSNFATGAETPRVLELRTQTVEGVTYFHVRLERPANLKLPAFDTSRPFSDADRAKFAHLPALVPQDNKTRTVYFRYRPTAPSLSFFGQVTGQGKAKLLLLYPAAPAAGAADTDKAPAAAAEKSATTAPQSASMATAEMPCELDFSRARVVPLPKLDPADQHLQADDLRSHWALHQAAHFAVLETQVLDFPFYGFAREATGRKYGVVSPPWVKREVGSARHRLYEITTGADAIAETLQLDRMLSAGDPSQENRNVPLSEVVGVTVPEQPWDRLLAGKEPTIEPLARYVPHDNYYLQFSDVRKFIEMSELLDQWGTSLIRVYEMKSRDYQLRQRYERQLCLKSTALGKALGPALVKGLAITGQDLYLREGTDVTVVFHVVKRELFLAAVEGFVQDARRAEGGRLSESRDDYHGVTIERFVTPLREVSLHRAAVKDAALGEFVIYSNSPAGIRRVLDAHQKRIKRLADASDFRYLRTIFPLDDKRDDSKRDTPKSDPAKSDHAEDGFVFLSDAFIRQMTGPASRIKEKRRLEALTSAYMLTNAALFCAWESGQLPRDHAAALVGAGLRPDDVQVPDGKGVNWDPQRQLAVSDIYNTIHFATPLVELPIDRVTPSEAQGYARFRDEYSRLWQTYFDPIGMRLAFGDRGVRVETHILPLAASGAYRTLRETAVRSTFRFIPTQDSVADFRAGIGDQQTVVLRWEKSKVLREIVDLLLRWESDPSLNLRQEYDRLFWKLPISVGVLGEASKRGIGNAKDLVELAKTYLAPEEEPREIKYKGTTLYRVVISPVWYRAAAAFFTKLSPDEPLANALLLLPTQEPPPALYVASTEDMLHISASEDFLKKLIDESDERRKAGDKKPADPARDVNAALLIAPSNARDAVSLLLAHEARGLGLLNNQVWNCFYQCGLLTSETGAANPREGDKIDREDKDRANVVRKFLGFVPVSPDGSAYRYDQHAGEVLNPRHGTYRRPQLQRDVDPDSELGRLLAEIVSLRAELRFHENSFHAVLTIDRK